MNISRQLALGMATGAILVFMLGFVTLSHSVDQSHMRLILHYFCMGLYLLIAVAVMPCAYAAFQNAAPNGRHHLELEDTPKASRVFALAWLSSLKSYGVPVNVPNKLV